MSVRTYGFILGLLSLTGSLLADTESLKLEKPIAIGSGDAAVIALEDGGVVAWKAKEQNRIVDDFRAKPSSLADVTHLEFHRDFISIIGKRNDLPSMATFKLGKTLSVSTNVVPGLTVPLEFATDKTITATTSTAIAIYFAVKDEAQTSIWMIGANAASLDEPKQIYKGSETILAMVVNYQGHLLVAVETEGKPTIQFHHSQQGDKLVQIPTTMESITSLAVSPSELLYAAGSKDGKQGVYRLDAAFSDGKQIVRDLEVQLIDGARQIVCFEKQAVVLTDDEAIRFDLAE